MSSESADGEVANTALHAPPPEEHILQNQSSPSTGSHKQSHDRRVTHAVGHPDNLVSLQLDINEPRYNARIKDKSKSGMESQRNTLSEVDGQGLEGKYNYGAQEPNLKRMSSMDTPKHVPSKSSDQESRGLSDISDAKWLTIQELTDRHYVGPFQNLPGEASTSLSMKVIDHWEDIEAASYFRSAPIVYVVQCHYLGYEWTRNVRRPQLLSMHLTLKFYFKYIRTRNNMLRASGEKFIFFKKFLGKNFHYPKELKLEQMYSVEQKIEGLQAYLDALCESPLALNHEAFCEYFRVSNYSFKIRYGESLREERLEMRVTQAGLARERKRASIDCCCFVCFCVVKPCRCNCRAHGNSRWAILKPGCLIFAGSPTDPIDRPMEVVTFDSTLRVHVGALQTGSPLKIIVTTSELTLEMSFKTKKKAMYWARSIVLAKGNCEWVVGHANSSFAPVRPAFGSLMSGEASQIMTAALPCVDGLDYFQNLYTAICAAEHEIFITDWWMHPFTFLKRPAKRFPGSRLDRLLKSRAKAGVRVYILLWKELELAVPHNSFFTSRYLHELHPNILVMRYPNHFGSKGVRYWSHHDKMVVIDQQVAFIGGLDLTYGRWDTFEHHLFDYEDKTVIETEETQGTVSTLLTKIDTDIGMPKATPDSTQGPHEGHDEESVNGDQTEDRYRKCADDTGMHGGGNFPSRDYYNCRVKDFEDVMMWSDSIDRTKVPRMPWHDVHCMLVGEAAQDVGRHFVHRWNFTLAAKGSSRRPLVPTVATPWMWQYALRNPAWHLPSDSDGLPSARTSTQSTEISVQLSSPRSAIPLKSQSEPSEIRSDSLDLTQSRRLSMHSESKVSHLFNLNTKIRFISILRQSNNKPFSSFSKTDTRTNLAHSGEEKTASRATLKDVRGNHYRKNSFTRQQNHAPVDMVDAIQMGFGGDDKDPDHKHLMQVDEDEEHFIKLEKQNKKKLSKKNRYWYHKTKKPSMTRHTDARKDNKSLRTKAVHRILKKDKDHHMSAISLRSNGFDQDKKRQHIRGNVTYHGIKLVNTEFISSGMSMPSARGKAGFLASSAPKENGFNVSRHLSKVVHALPAAIATECQVVRSMGEWSGGLHENSIHTAYQKLISNSERYIIIENQFFISGMSGDQRVKNRLIEEIYKRITRAHVEQPHRFKVYIFIPLLPSAEGDIDHSPVIRACMYWQFQTLCRGKRSLFSRLRDDGIKPEDYVSVFALRTWAPTPGSGVPVSELIYIHSKVMIVDDEWAIIGSANINDRSLVGNRDSEIAVVIHDTAQFVEIELMNGSKINVGKFGYELRTRLLQEHCGITSAKIDQFDDLSSDEVWNKINSLAQKNTDIFEQVFGCVPSNNIHSISELRKYRHKLTQFNISEAGSTSNTNVSESVDNLSRQNRPEKTDSSNKAELKQDASSKINEQSLNESTIHDQEKKGAESKIKSLALTSKMMDSKSIHENSCKQSMFSDFKSKKVDALSQHPVPDCYCMPPDPGDEKVMETLSNIQGHIVKYPLDFFCEENASSLLPHIGEKEFLVKQHFFT